ncbi:MAG: alpha/beta hydrolase, partial [Pseudomonas sp.]|nr:alpha/beta hydrolase [Pseudomonas sp.]
MKMTVQNNRTSKTRRRPVGSSILAFTLFGVLGAAHAQTTATAQPATISAGATHAATSALGPLKHVNAGLLNVAYAETGPADGPVVILLHGWPYDIHSYDEVAPLL